MYFVDRPAPKVGHPIPYEKMTKIKGPTIKHLEQLWDEINKLKERIRVLEKNDR